MIDMRYISKKLFEGVDMKEVDFDLIDILQKFSVISFKIFQKTITKRMCNN